jgi:magnesium chelatase subunit D
MNYPFPAIVGMTAAKHALMLLAVDPRLKGVLIASASGSAKSTLARSFASIIPSNHESERLLFTETPLNVTEERLLGGVDLERTLATGKRKPMTGLLAEADSGLLYADDINLLQAGIADHIAAALDQEAVRVEREGVSVVHSARFVLIGTYNATEGEVSAHLRERVGLIVESDAENSSDDLSYIIDRTLRFEKDPAGFVDEYAIETADLKATVCDARLRLAGVRITREYIRRIAQAAISLGVEGNRADAFATRAARANAALNGRDSVEDEDIIAAIQLVLLPRASTIPMRQSPSHSNADSNRDESNEDDEREPEDFDSEIKESPRAIEDLMIAALDSLPPEGALAAAGQKARRDTAGKRSDAIDLTRGRYVGSSAIRNNQSKLAIDATLRAAAPFQKARRFGIDNARTNATERAKNRIKIAKYDLRFKRLKSRTGILFIFAVDTSGSMSLNRMAQAKGALARLLQQAYLHRDKVALISFRRKEAEILLAPTRSVELAKQIVDGMPTGGATPIAAAVVKALEIARLARLRGISQAMLVLLTDGRSNVGLQDEMAQERLKRCSAIDEELQNLGMALQSANIASVVIDTKSRFVSSGEGGKLAEKLGGRYLYLPRADSTAIYNAVTAAASQARMKV